MILIFTLCRYTTIGLQELLRRSGATESNYIYNFSEWGGGLLLQARMILLDEFCLSSGLLDIIIQHKIKHPEFTVVLVARRTCVLPPLTAVLARSVADFIILPTHKMPYIINRLRMLPGRGSKPFNPGKKYPILTPRESDVFSMMVIGKSNTSISAVLNISPKTVYTHQRNICKKFLVRRVADFYHLSPNRETEFSAKGDATCTA